MILQIHPQAENEVRSAARWYEKQRAGLGLEFLATVDAGMARIESDPRWFPRLDGPGSGTSLPIEVPA